MVYDRKTHFFSISDLLRIGKKLSSLVVSVSAAEKQQIIDCIIDTVSQGSGSVEFGGGDFGGGGSTRAFNFGTASDDRKIPVDVIIIVEKR